MESLRAETRRLRLAGRAGEALVAARRARVVEEEGERRERVRARHQLFAQAMAEASEGVGGEVGGVGGGVGGGVVGGGERGTTTEDVAFDLRSGVPAEVAHIVSRILGGGAAGRRPASQQRPTPAQAEMEALARNIEMHRAGGSTVRLRFSDDTVLEASFSPFETARALVRTVCDLAGGPLRVLSVATVRGAPLLVSPAEAAEAAAAAAAAAAADADSPAASGKQDEEEDEREEEDEGVGSGAAEAADAAARSVDGRLRNAHKALADLFVVPKGTVNVQLAPDAPSDWHRALPRTS
jgi:hypothetical protein